MRSAPTPAEWNRAVQASQVPNHVRVICAYLARHMYTRGGIARFVSVPRPVMAESLGKPEETVKRWVKDARAAGVLTVVRHGRKGRTLELQGTMPEPAEHPLDVSDLTLPDAARGPYQSSDQLGAPGPYQLPDHQTSQRTGLGVRNDPLSHGATYGNTGLRGSEMTPQLLHTQPAGSYPPNSTPGQDRSGTPAGNPAHPDAGLLNHINDGQPPDSPEAEETFPPDLDSLGDEVRAPQADERRAETGVPLPGDPDHRHEATAVTRPDHRPDRSRPTNLESGAA